MLLSRAICPSIYQWLIGTEVECSPEEKHAIVALQTWNSETCNSHGFDQDFFLPRSRRRPSIDAAGEKPRKLNRKTENRKKKPHGKNTGRTDGPQPISFHSWADHANACPRAEYRIYRYTPPWLASTSAAHPDSVFWMAQLLFSFIVFLFFFVFSKIEIFVNFNSF
jgi:hypothetical protein